MVRGDEHHLAPMPGCVIDGFVLARNRPYCWQRDARSYHTESRHLLAETVVILGDLPPETRSAAKGRSAGMVTRVEGLATLFAEPTAYRFEARFR